ncbi:MAG: class I SAM-dependent methyltransferase [Campylobacterota bacterium]|nr:class I SAM-dependent methyltransferase [Campylobacterota bacterium]
MLCKICNQPTQHYFDTQMQWDFYHCKACEFFFKDPKHYLEDDQEIRVYQNHNNSFESPGYVEMFESFMDATFKPYIKEIKTVLEFGCGPGPVLATLLEQQGLHVSKYDKFFFPEKVYESQRYDLISSTEVLEHIDTPNAIMQFFHQHLQPKGYLAIMTQFHSNNEKEFLQWWYRKDPTHICFFTPHTFEVLAQKHGFKVLHFDTKKHIFLQKI